MAITYQPPKPKDKPVKPKKKVSVHGITTKMMGDGAELKASVPVLVKETVEHPCVVGFHASQTVNMGDYNSAKIGVSLSMPCAPDELEDTYAFVESWVDQKMTELLDGVHKAVDNKGKDEGKLLNMSS